MNIDVQCKRNYRWLIGLLLVSVSWSVGSANPLSPRVQIGLNLLPAVMAADLGVNELINKSEVTIYLGYQNDHREALGASQQLARISDIRGVPLKVVVIEYDILLDRQLNTPAAVFLVEKTPLKLARLIEFSRANKAILFSPFKGDVEKGVSAGFDITHKVVPAVNIESLKKANIVLKSFFLRVAVKYGR